MLNTLYGNGRNVRNWLHGEEHIDALLLAAPQGKTETTCCLGGHVELTTKKVVEAICQELDFLLPKGAPYPQSITLATDQPAHDRPLEIDTTRISTEHGWLLRHSFQEGLAATMRWFIEQQGWCDRQSKESGCTGTS